MTFPNQQQATHRGPVPLRQQAIGTRLVAPYRTGPWSGGTMVTFAFVVIPLFAAVAASSAADVLAVGFGNAAEDDKSSFLGGLALAGIPALYLCVASLVNVARFASLRRNVLAHYAAARDLAGRDPHTDHELARVIGDDGELYREDHRRHILRNIGGFFGGILSILSIFDGGPVVSGPSADSEIRGSRAGQSGYKLFWGVVVIGGGAVGIYFLEQDSAQVLAVIGVYVGINLVWWLPSLWRSVALRRVDAAWREGAAAAYARLPVPMPHWCAPTR